MRPKLSSLQAFEICEMGHLSCLGSLVSGCGSSVVFRDGIWTYCTRDILFCQVVRRNALLLRSFTHSALVSITAYHYHHHLCPDLQATPAEQSVSSESAIATLLCLDSTTGKIKTPERERYNKEIFNSHRLDVSNHNASPEPFASDGVVLARNLLEQIFRVVIQHHCNLRHHQLRR